MNKIKNLLKLFRPELPFSAGICVVLGQVFALGKFPSLLSILSGFAAVFFISASALILNDYFDYEVDKINAPTRPLPSKQVSIKEVISLSIIISLLGLYISYLIGLEIFVFSVFIWLIGFLYNWKVKKCGLPGNILVCISVGSTFIFGGLSVGVPFNKTVWFFAVLSALIDLGEEIAADAMDVEGDKKLGSVSVAIRYGKKNAIRISSLIFIIIILLTSIPFIYHWFSAIYLVPVLIMDVIIFYSQLRLHKPISDSKKRIYIRLIYLSGLSAILLFLLFILIL